MRKLKFFILMLGLLIVTLSVSAMPRIGAVTTSNSIVGSNTNDSIGGDDQTYELPNGNIVIRSPYWNGNRGAVTCLTPEQYRAGNIVISASNSLTGSSADDRVGSEITILANGNFIVGSPFWDNGGTVDAGAVTWVNGNTCIPHGETGTGAVVSATNSLTGSTSDDRVGSVLTEVGNSHYAVGSPNWDNSGNVNVGAVTWVNGSTGMAGAVSNANSLVGTTAGDYVGEYVLPLSNGNYVTHTPGWHNGVTEYAGAVTWANGNMPTVGSVNSSNSLVGFTAYDQVGDKVIALENGNYVVVSVYWDNVGAIEAGAVTWGNGNGGTVGTVNGANSLVGSLANDSVGLSGITELTNGNYVIASSLWNNYLGAVTWASGTAPITGVVSGTNSLIGSATDDRVGSGGVYALTNGHYVVSSPSWANGGEHLAGAVTWGNGNGGTVGVTTATNSLVGSNSVDSVGREVLVLENGHYVVGSGYWDNGAITNAGAATWGNGSGGTVGPITAANSLVGSTNGDFVGEPLVALSNGNYVVRSSSWDNGAIVDAGAVTWANGNGGTVGTITPNNSIVGSTLNDQVGFGDVVGLTNGHYVVHVRQWDHGPAVDAGAVMWANGSGGTVGTINSSNALVGTLAADFVGDSGIYALPNGHYVVASEMWTDGTGAVTWGNGNGGTVGAVSASNSLVGALPKDFVGNKGVTALSNGHYVVNSTEWDNGAIVDVGAVTLGNGSTGTTGVVSVNNSLVGVTAEDRISSDGIVTLNAGGFLVLSPSWDNGAVVDAGAITYSDGDFKVELLLNTSFETRDDVKASQAENWNFKLSTKDKRRCNNDLVTFSRTGDCAYRFVGSAAEASQIAQPLGDVSSLTAGTVLNASVYYKTNAVTPRLKVKLKVFYTGVAKPKVTSGTINLPSLTGYIPFNLLPYIIEAGAPVSKVKFQFQNRAKSGKIYLDDASLNYVSQ